MMTTELTKLNEELRWIDLEKLAKYYDCEDILDLEDELIENEIYYYEGIDNILNSEIARRFSLDELLELYMTDGFTLLGEDYEDIGRKYFDEVYADTFHYINDYNPDFLYYIEIDYETFGKNFVSDYSETFETENGIYALD